MYICFLITRLDSVGGAQIHVRDTAARLADDGHRVAVIAGERPVNEDFLPQSVQLVVVPHLRRDVALAADARSLKHLSTCISQLQPDIVSIHSSKAGLLGRLACKRLGQRCLFTAHGWVFTDGVPMARRSLYRMCEKVVSGWASRIITVSDKDHALGLDLGISPSRLTRIHNGVKDVKYDAQRAGSPSPRLRVVMVARFDKQKDQPLLLNALREVPDVHATFIGDGPLLEDRKAMASALGVSDRARFEGYRSAVQEELNSADAFVLCSNWEGFPRTSLEAMRASLPVVVSDVGGAKEAVVEGQTGFCIPRGDLEALIHRLRLLVRYPELRAKMGEEGRKRFLAEFTFDRMYRQTVQVYDEVFGG
jgi:glycosyltransferase involved in cell wall biosynthesis